MVLNQRCLPKHPSTALGSTHVSWAEGVAPSIDIFSACSSGTPSPPSNCTSAHMLCGDASVLGGGLLEPCRRPTTRTLPHSMSEWSDHHQARCLSACEGATPAIFLLFWAGSSLIAFYPGLSPTPGATLLLVSTFTFRLRQGTGSTFLRLSGRPGIHCLWPVAPRHAREVRRPFLQMDLSTSK